MQSTTADLAKFKVAYLRPERCVVRVHRHDDLAADALVVEASNADGGAAVAYRSIHGGVITATEETFRLLDTFLENRLPEAFVPLEERKHWDDPGADPLPAGPGPRGSGVRGLGSAGERIDLTVGPDPDLTYDPEDDDEYDEENYDHHDMSDAAPHRREPWREVVGDRDLLLSWLISRMRWTMNDGRYTEFPSNPRQEAARERTHATRRELADKLVTAFPPGHSRYFIGAHAGWDRWHEDYLDRDEVIAFVSSDQITVLWMDFFRHYG